MKFDDVTFPLPQKNICSVLEDLIRNSGLIVPQKNIHCMVTPFNQLGLYRDRENYLNMNMI